MGKNCPPVSNIYKCPVLKQLICPLFGVLPQLPYPKAVECISKDRESLLTFYDFPVEHWIHIRTTNVIESSFATVRHRTRQA